MSTRVVLVQKLHTEFLYLVEVQTNPAAKKGAQHSQQKSLKGCTKKCCARSHQGKGNPTRAPPLFQDKSYLIVSVNS